MFRYAEGACGVNSEALHKLEFVEPGGVVIERLAVQHLVLLLLRFLFLAFVEQHSTLFLVAVPIQQARQGKAGQSKHSSACTCMAHDAVPVGHICWLTQKGARKNKCDIPLLIPGIQICTYGYVHSIPGTISRARGSKLLLIQTKHEFAFAFASMSALSFTYLL